jgi:hypothetical protein
MTTLKMIIPSSQLYVSNSLFNPIISCNQIEALIKCTLFVQARYDRARYIFTWNRCS